MRTTLNLDPDVLAVVKALAAQRQLSVGEVVSDLVRRSLRPDGTETKTRNGVPLFPVARNAKTVTPELVRSLLEETE